MGDGLTPAPDLPRGSASTSLWSADCKDCRTERAAQARAQGAGGGGKRKGAAAGVEFEYSGSWARRKLDRGETRSDRCERHRRSHAGAIRAFAVPYVDLRVIGEVADPAQPSGPLGGLGPLPVLHRERQRETDLARQPFGMTDADILTLLNGLSQKRVAIVEAGTGTGKSTFMPFRLMNPPEGAAYRPTAFGPIVVTEPRRVAATGVARFVGEDLCHGCDSRSCSRHIGPGFQVGYQVSGEKYWDGACELIYVTDGTMINWVRDGQLARMSMVIIDEAHERSENIDIILAQLREMLRQHEHLRVVITSATLDRDFFLSYFGGPEKVFEQAVPATKSFGYGTPLFIGTDINEAVLQDGLAVTPDLRFPGWPDDGGLNDHLGDEDLKRTSRALAKLRCVDEIPMTDWRRDMPSAVVDQVVAIASGTEWGDILAFLPTSDVIQNVVGWIRDELDERNLDFDVYPLLASTPKAISDKAIAARSRGDKRKIVVSSNLAETSLTVKGVRYVVDSGLICQEEWDPLLASGSFPVKPHSQAALRQRWGRVGRDMPGWVFPLYTPEQFLALPRNTPPETVQKSLEGHYMKLLSSGLDPDNMPLPGGHAAEGAELDKAGRDNIELFERESHRARRALVLAGAVDADGHLTEFGRDVERFPGEGANALAIMLGDQLACVHEVILALLVLGEGQLAGNRMEAGKSDYILAVDERWPLAWRVRAAQAHRGLALGCRDELDVLLRVVALYQAAPDRADWCARWWVNSAMIDAALESMMDQVDLLSAAMKEDARRNIMPALGGRARAVLSRTMVSARFRRAGGGVYVSGGEVEAEQATLAPNILVTAPEQILALNRFRRGRAREDGAPRPAEISHIVEFLPWAALASAGSGDLGLDLIMRAVENLSSADEDNHRRALAVLDALPVGTLADFELGPGSEVRSFTCVAAPFACEGNKSNGTSARDPAGSGFDREWDPRRQYLGEEPEEEQALRILKAQNQETNDEASDEPTPVPAGARPVNAKAASLGRMVCRTATEVALLDGTVRGLVSGYRITPDGALELVIQPVEAALASAAPGRHPDLLAWEEIQVTVAGVVYDHKYGYLQLDRIDLRGSFYLPERGGGLDLFDTDFIHRLKAGARLTARVLPAKQGEMTATLLPMARAQLATAEVETRTKKGDRIRVFAGTILSEPTALGWAMLELDCKDPKSGVSFQFGVRKSDLEWGGLAAPFEGAKLLVGLQPARDGSRKGMAAELDEGTRSQAAVLRAPDEEIAERARAQAALDVKGLRIRASARDVPFASVVGLIEASPNTLWRRDVWAFYEHSLHLSVAAVYPVSPRIDLPVRVASLVHLRKAQFESALGITLFVGRREATVSITSPENEAAARARKALTALAEAPRLSVRIGVQRVNQRAVEARHDISHVWVEDGVATILGASARACEDAMRELLKPARGELVVPTGKSGRLIGKGGSDINRLRAVSRCDAESPGKDDRWEVRGPSAACVETFLSQAKTLVPGSIGRVTNRGELDPLPDPPRPSPAGPVAAWRTENPDFFADVSLAQLERLAGAKSQLPPLKAVRVRSPAPPPEIAKPAPASGGAVRPRVADDRPVKQATTPAKQSGGVLSWISKLFE